jgi:hypothetical protein
VALDGDNSATRDRKLVDSTHPRPSIDTRVNQETSNQNAVISVDARSQAAEAEDCNRGLESLEAKPAIHPAVPASAVALTQPSLKSNLELVTGIIHLTCEGRLLQSEESREGQRACPPTEDFGSIGRKQALSTKRGSHHKPYEIRNQEEKADDGKDSGSVQPPDTWARSTVSPATPAACDATLIRPTERRRGPNCGEILAHLVEGGKGKALRLCSAFLPPFSAQGITLGGGVRK